MSRRPPRCRRTDTLFPSTTPFGAAVSATPSMASAWLVPRLGGFLAAHPQIEISLQSTESVVDFSRETQIVAALRIGLGQWPGVVSEPLFDAWLVPMARPALVERMRGLRARTLGGWSLTGGPEGRRGRGVERLGGRTPGG